MHRQPAWVVVKKGRDKTIWEPMPVLVKMASLLKHAVGVQLRRHCKGGITSMPLPQPSFGGLFRKVIEGRPSMSFEDQLNKLNVDFFFREFTFSKNTFRPTPQSEVELADNIIWLEDLLITFQLKERTVGADSSPEAEAGWFEKKVVKNGTRQIRDTLTYLESNTKIALRNNRDHVFNLDASKITTHHSVICYLPHPNLPLQYRMKKFHRSTSAGMIHLFPASDYLGVLRTLITPPELSHYLTFRATSIEKWANDVNSVPEQALVGQYLAGVLNTGPTSEFISYLAKLDQQIDEWDLSGIIGRFPDRMTTENENNEYYKILAELAKLQRGELREFKKRYRLAMETCRADESALPSRIYCPRTSCGFVFIPLTKDVITRRRQGLQNLTFAHKYDQKLDKCIGISFAPEDGGWYSVEWCYVDFRWEFDGNLQALLKKSNPFNSVTAVEMPRYSFRTS